MLQCSLVAQRFCTFGKIVEPTVQHAENITKLNLGCFISNPNINTNIALTLIVN